MINDNLKNSHCSLSITSDKESPEIISQLLGIQPSRSFHKGETYQSPSSGSIITRPHNLWEINTADAALNKNIDRHISYLRNALEPRVLLIHHLKTKLKCNIYFWVWITSPDSVVSVDISVINTKFLSALKAPVKLSILTG